MFANKGQGSLEYLLILGGAILVAVIIIAAITLLPNNSPVELNALAANCQTSLNQNLCQSTATPASLVVAAVDATHPGCPQTGTVNSVAGAGTACCWTGSTADQGTCRLNPNTAQRP
ncbi:MAG: class III signal peptide-containing protein [Candidatus Diapherotrites archaeon]|uniref:Class III signal peptide-containing protein n=1 Tax=Candidatus Iainarchaeum sp. TaxID=3101447 RepID=A0A8T4L3Q3_9ARCH|nr:class III signal peptide-containing protein [Candidatus Diapherotrites archaeon]